MDQLEPLEKAFAEAIYAEIRKGIPGDSILVPDLLTALHMKGERIAFQRRRQLIFEILRKAQTEGIGRLYLGRRGGQSRFVLVKPVDPFVFQKPDSVLGTPETTTNWLEVPFSLGHGRVCSLRVPEDLTDEEK